MKGERDSLLHSTVPDVSFCLTRKCEQKYILRLKAFKQEGDVCLLNNFFVQPDVELSTLIS